MDCQIFYDATDISSSTVSYDRDNVLCASQGVIRLTLKVSAPVTPELYHTIVLYEGGNKKGSWYIHTIDKDTPDGTMILSGQDASLKLQEYFIAENYFVDYPSASDYWIKKFLAEAQVSYSFDGVTTGSLLSNNTSFGMATAIDTITPLLQQNGWYMYFDGDNVAHIGKLSLDTTTYSETLHDNEIISISTVKHDRMFRNRALVFGNGNPTKHTQVKAEIDKHGSYSNEYPGGHDIRSVVCVNSNIKQNADAYAIAGKMIKEFEQTNYEISLDVAGDWDIELGDYIFVESEFLNRAGLVTTIGSSMSATGLVTHIVLNQRCPRLFAFYDIGGRVYVGTDREGVWRKPLKFIHTWENYSTGITDLHIIDLAVDNGALACVTNAGHAYLRTESNASWTRFNPSLVDTTSGYPTVTYPAASGKATCCAFDKTTGQAIVGFTLVRNASGDPSRSWISYANSASNYRTYQLHDEEGITGYEIFSIDNNGTTNVASVVANYSGVPTIWNNLEYFGGYQLDHTDAYTRSGYDLVVINSGVNIGNTYNLYDYNVVGDGKYIYDLAFTSSPVSPFGDSLYIREFSTITDLEKTYSWETDDKQFNSGFAGAVGERTIVQPYYDGNSLAFHSYNFKTEKSHDYKIIDNAYVLGTYSTINEGKRKFYCLTTPGTAEPSTSLKMIYYSPDINRVFEVAWNGIAGDSHGGTYGGIDYVYPKRAFQLGDDYIAFLLQASYHDVPYDEFFVDITVPVIVFYKMGSGIMHVNYAADGLFMGIGGLDALVGWDYYSGGALDNKFYATFRIDNPGSASGSTYLQCYFDILGMGGVNYNSEDDTPLPSVVGDRENLYMAWTSGSNFQLRKASTGLLHYQIAVSDLGDYNLYSQLDSQSHSFFIYREDTGDITCYPLASGGGYTYDINMPPNTTPYRGVDPTSIVTHAAFVNDTFFTNAVSVYNVGMGVYTRSVKFYVKPPISGTRVSPVDYTAWATDDPMVLKGQLESPYIQVLDTAVPYQVECSQTSPFTVFGGTSFSGIIISGIQTGWNQGQMYLSDTGKENTWTDVIMNSLHSYVSDARVLNMFSNIDQADTGGAYFGKYIMYPQPTEEVIPASGGTTELCLLNVSALPEDSVIITSGTLNQYGSVYRTFSGYLNHIETTNTQDIPYMFASISGIPPVFYQKDGVSLDEIEEDYIDRTNNLPMASITCIRADDVI